jgi:hypothetical protein
MKRYEDVLNQKPQGNVSKSQFLSRLVSCERLPLRALFKQEKCFSISTDRSKGELRHFEGNPKPECRISSSDLSEAAMVTESSTLVFVDLKACDRK